MASIDQIRANHENALLSTGPRSAAGKQISALNRTTHGLAGRRIVLKSENQAEYDELLASLMAEYHPRSAMEEELVHEIAGNAWRLRRANRVEADLFDSADDDFHSVSSELDKIRRYRSAIERAWHKAIEQLRKVQASRPKPQSDRPSPSQDPLAALDKAMRDYLFAPLPNEIGFESQIASQADVPEDALEQPDHH